MDDDLERARAAEARSYRACWVGFSLYALNLVAASLVELASMALLFSGRKPNPGNWLGIDPFQFAFGFDAMRTWSRLVSCLALAAAWPEQAGWRKRSGLLLVMAIGDVALWAVLDAVPLGLASEPTRHLVFCHYLRGALGWSRSLLLASLASDFSRSAGVPGAAEFGRAARSTATTGAVVWFLFFMSRISWRGRAWPLAERRWTFDASQLLMAYQIIAMLCLVQGSLLTLRAGRAAAQALRDLARQEPDFDPWTASSAAGSRGSADRA